MNKDSRLASSAQVTLTIKVDGKEIPDSFQVVSINTWTAVNRIPAAKIVLFDGSPAAGDFPISNLETFLPGNKVEILAGYVGAEDTIFQGVIDKQGIEPNLRTTNVQ